mgnify:CR=1 FL=1
MKKNAAILLLAAILLAVSGSLAFAINIPVSKELDKLLTERQADCWVEGEAFGDIVLGARGSIEFIYLDEALSKAITKEPGLASWVDDLNQYYGSPSTRKKLLFIAQVVANKPWTLEEEKIFVGNYHLNKKDIISSSWKSPFQDGAIDEGAKWQFAFVVPASVVKKGQKINIGYGDDFVEWRMP